MATAIDRKQTKEARKKARKEKFQQSSFGRWLDHCFYKEVKVDLSEKQDGSLVKTIRKPRLTKMILITLAVLIVLGVSFIPFNYTTSVRFTWASFWENFVSLFTPSEFRTKDSSGWWKFGWESFTVGIKTTTMTAQPFIQIFEICFLGTLLGALLSIPVYYLCANNVNPNPYTRNIIKIFNDFLRCIPMFILCVIFSLIFGSGTIFPAVLAIALFSLGIMYQMMYEYIETLNMQPFESIRSTGANNLQSVNVALHPEIKPMFFAYFIYTLEINIRASVVLSYVGLSSTYMNALQYYIDSHWYDYVGTMLIPLFIIVASLQIISNTLVRKLR